ncbi:MAG: ATPase, partial [Selenomonadaceae bacterium]|nr:ATPase [Selenomonadaceae bacterium]
MSVRDILDKIENLVAGASHVPLSGKCMIDENDLVHLVEELRNDLPNELSQANQIMKDREKILGDAQKEADHIVDEAKK